MSESLGTNSDYHPTQGVRILEFERQITADPKKTKKWVKENVEVELWDCGGDISLLSGVANDANGVIFIANADSKNENELNEWQGLFPNLKPQQLCIFANRHLVLPNKPKYKTGLYY
jgi:Rab-like protein 5